jgi:hypothetical protein
MKTARALAQCGALLGAGILLAHADGGSADSSAPASAPAPTKTNPTGPWMMWTPPVRPDTGDAPAWNGATGDGVGEGGNSASEGTEAENTERIAEQTYAMNQEKQQHPEETLDQTAKQQTYDQDWLLRNYTDELKKRHLEKADYTNPYLSPEPALDSSKSLLSDDPLLAPPDEEKKKTAKADSTASDLDTRDTLTPKKPLTTLTFQPLLGAFGSTPATARPDATGTLTDLGSMDSGASLLPVPNGLPAGNVSTSPDTSIVSMLDVPGLTAASQGGIAPNNAIDFDDSGAPTARPRPSATNDFMIPTAQANDVTEFFKKQAEALAPPTMPGTVPTVALPPKSRLVLNPEPTAKPTISGLRTHVDDPFDILQR